MGLVEGEAVGTPHVTAAAPEPDWCLGPAGTALAGVACAVDRLAAVDLAVPGTGAILDVLRGVERQIRRLQGVSLAVIGQIDQRGPAAPQGQTSTSALVRQVITVGKGESYQRVRLSAEVCPSTGLSGAPVRPRFPVVAAAVADGALSVKHADVIASTIGGFPAAVPAQLRASVEEFLVEQGRTLDPRTLENLAREIALMADPDGTADERGAHEKMEFHLGRRHPDGLTRCWGLLDDLTVEAMRTAFGALGAPSAQRSKYDHTDPPSPEPTDSTTSTKGSTQGSDSARPDTAGPAGPDSPDIPDSPGSEIQADVVEAGGEPAADLSDGADDVGTDSSSGPDDLGADRSSGPQAPVDPEADLEEMATNRDSASPDAQNGRSPSEPGPGCPAPVSEGVGASGEPAAPPPIWRPSRVPYVWAPLGTVASDYPPPRSHAGPPPPEPAGSGAPSSEGWQPPDQPPPGENDPPPERRTAGTRRAQALAVILEKFLDLGCAPIQAGERPHVLVTVDEQSLRRRTASGRLAYGERLPIDQVRMLACDSKVLPAVLAGRSDVVDMGRAMRSFNAACRRAILARDVGCVFPACDMPALWAENHHIRHWADGGDSDYRNGVLLCRRHHILIHTSDWQVRLAGDGHAEVVPPITHDLFQRPLRNTLHRPPAFNWPASSPRHHVD